MLLICRLRCDYIPLPAAVCLPQETSTFQMILTAIAAFTLRFLIVTAFVLQSLRLGRGYDYKLLQRYAFSVRKQELQAELLDLQIMIRNILRLLIRCRVRPNGFGGMFRIVAGRSAHRATKSPLRGGD